MTAPSIGIKDLLLAATPAVGVFGNPTQAQIASGVWGIFVSKQPDDAGSPDRAITIYDSGGLDPSPGWLLDYPSVQVVVRGEQNRYSEAYDKAIEIQKVILGKAALDLNGDRWVQFNQAGGVGFIGYDQNRRPELSINFNLIIQPGVSSGQNRSPLL